LVVNHSPDPDDENTPYITPPSLTFGHFISWDDYDIPERRRRRKEDEEEEEYHHHHHRLEDFSSSLEVKTNTRKSGGVDHLLVVGSFDTVCRTCQVSGGGIGSGSDSVGEGVGGNGGCEWWWY